MWLWIVWFHPISVCFLLHAVDVFVFSFVFVTPFCFCFCFAFPFPPFAWDVSSTHVVSVIFPISHRRKRISKHHTDKSKQSHHKCFPMRTENVTNIHIPNTNHTIVNNEWMGKLNIGNSLVLMPGLQSKSVDSKKTKTYQNMASTISDGGDSPVCCKSQPSTHGVNR